MGDGPDYPPSKNDRALEKIFRVENPTKIIPQSSYSQVAQLHTYGKGGENLPLCCLLYPIEIFWERILQQLRNKRGNLLRRLRRRRKRKSSKMDFPCNNKIMDSIMKLWQCRPEVVTSSTVRIKGVLDRFSLKQSTSYYTTAVVLVKFVRLYAIL